ncbi:glycosyltransferase|uniref:Glycosyltransferase n=1 Tax=Leuconostoc lactis TaxID=1246 RepID=A0A6L7AAZ3_LEULA|nr:glycosyltransferase [Leuconostoc lactis]
MVLYFENNKQVDAATGTILTQKSAIEGTQNKRLKLLQRNGSGETLYHCIASIAASSYPKALIQIIVANNHSTDNSFQVFHQAQADFPELRLQWMNTDAGKARALNV